MLGASRLASRRRRRGRRIWALEGLEERALLSGNPTLYTVTDLSDSATDTGSLRHAIAQANANANPAGSLIEFDPALDSAPRTITLANPLELSETAGPELIDGPGSGIVTISGDHAVRVFQVDSGVIATISGLTLSNGLAPPNGPTGEGGGIDNAGTLALRDVTISDCSALPGYGGGIYNAGTLSLVNSTITRNRTIFSGGGIWNDSGRMMTITNSTISDNSTTSFGGGIFNDGTLSISDSTLSGNSTGFDAGAIENGVDGRLTITSSTLAGNSSTNGVGGIGNTGSLMAMDSIFDNRGGGNVGNILIDAGPIVSGGHNLFSDAPAFAVDPSDLINTDPLLGPLADNGGPTLTMALLPGSPAIGAGVSVPGVTTDQRGIPRPQDSAPDIGAFESRGFTLAIASGDNQATATLSPFLALVLTVASPFGEPVAGGRITFSTPTIGASADLAGNSVTIDSGGRASIDAVANGLGGNYPFTARVAGANTVAFALTNVVIPPTVVGLQYIGTQHHPAALVLTFSEPMDAARAQDPANYRLVWAGRDDRLGTQDDRVIRVRRARYDPASQSVTLRLMHGQPLPRTLWITAAGASSGGLTNAAGMPLAGIGEGGPGGDRAVRFNLKALRKPIRLGLLPDGGFEGPMALPRNQARTLFAGDRTLAPWRITAGSVNVQTYWPAAEGMQTIDLNGVSPGTIEQSLATIPGQAYQLLFDFANNPDDRARTATATVTVTGVGTLLSRVIAHAGSTPRDMKYTPFLGTFVANSTTTTLQFASTTPGAYGIVLDAASVTAVPGVADPTPP